MLLFPNTANTLSAAEPIGPMMLSYAKLTRMECGTVTMTDQTHAPLKDCRGEWEESRGGGKGGGGREEEERQAGGVRLGEQEGMGGRGRGGASGGRACNRRTRFESLLEAGEAGSERAGVLGHSVTLFARALFGRQSEPKRLARLPHPPRSFRPPAGFYTTLGLKGSPF